MSDRGFTLGGVTRKFEILYSAPTDDLFWKSEQSILVERVAW